MKHSEKKHSQKILIFQEMELSGCKIKEFLIFYKKSLIFQEVELSSPKLKKLLIFQKELPKPQKPKFLILFQKNFCLIFSKNTLRQ